MTRLAVGSKAPPLSLVTIQSKKIAIPDLTAPLVHLQFRRFAGCPICNLHLRSVARRLGEIEAAGIREIVFFHSKAEDMIAYQGDLPFDCVADPEKRFYQMFGVETSLLGVMHPKGLIAALKGITSNHPSNFAQKEKNGQLGMPADFLIDKEGRILHLKYGSNTDDQWSVDELIGLAKIST